MITAFILILGTLLLIGGLLIVHYFKAVILTVVILFFGSIYWLFDDEPRGYGRHYHD